LDNPISVAIDLMMFRNNEPFTREDVRRELTKIPDLLENQIEHDFHQAFFSFRRIGIETKQELKNLLTSDKILDTLRQFYREELHRPQEHPIDPMAIATWGAVLFTNALSDSSLAFVLDGIRQSDEYRRVHGELNILTAIYGAREKWADVTSVVKARKSENRISFVVGNDIFRIDPLPGVRKSLKVTFVYRGKTHSIETSEDDRLELP
jgi:hypothetical protein